jgi:hypothetical protein
VSESSSGARDELVARTDAIESAYEFFLGYASQGLATESSSGEVRVYLRQFETAIGGLGAFFTDYVASLPIDPGPYRAFIEVIDRDARSALAATQLVLAQPSITSQIIDNFNASIHVRALLTDIFLIDEVLKRQ